MACRCARFRFLSGCHEQIRKIVTKRLPYTVTSHSLLVSVGVFRTFSLFSSLSFGADDTHRVYVEKKILGYTQKQVYDVVANIDDYYKFLPWCRQSEVVKERPDYSVAKLVVGFPPLLESYTSLITLKPHRLVRSISTDGHLFSHLENQWILSPGPQYPTGPSCIVNIKGSFEFRSVLYASMGSLFFDEVARTLAESFAARCSDLYGPDHLKKQKQSQVNNCLTRPNTVS